jgi:hypothetical protein
MQSGKLNQVKSRILCLPSTMARAIKAAVTHFASSTIARARVFTSIHVASPFEHRIALHDTYVFIKSVDK